MMEKVLSFIGAAVVASALSTQFAEAKETINVGVCVSWPGYAMLEVAKEKNLIP